MSDASDLPALVVDSQVGVSQEIARHIRNKALNVGREQHADDGDASDATLGDGFGKAGVERIASEKLQVLREEKARAERGDYDLNVDETIRWWTYTLHAYCRAHDQSAPPALLWLTFEALRCREATPPASVRTEVGLPAAPANLNAFVTAVKADGKADAIGKPFSQNQLAAEIGVARSTIRNWRSRDDYDRLRRTHAWQYKLYLERTEST